MAVLGPWRRPSRRSVPEVAQLLGKARMRASSRPCVSFLLSSLFP